MASCENNCSLEPLLLSPPRSPRSNLVTSATRRKEPIAASAAKAILCEGGGGGVLVVVVVVVGGCGGGGSHVSHQKIVPKDKLQFIALMREY